MMRHEILLQAVIRGARRFGMLAAVAGCGIVGAGETALAAEKAADAAAPAAVAIYERYCIACHDRGPGHPGTQNLAYRYGPEKAALADRDNLTPEYVRIMVRFGRGLMPGFRPSEISDEQLKILAEFLSAGPHPQSTFSTPAEAVTR
jgi:mono/diheme cytochrome c family protein